MNYIKSLYRLTKPGIVYGNALHVIAGSLLAFRFGFSLQAFVMVVMGTSLIIASACVANNLIDRDIDRSMLRTRSRPSVTGDIPIKWAILYLIVLLIIGISLLYIYVNSVVVLIGVVAYLLYVFVYGYAKRTTVNSTLIGSIPGALPALAGYVAITGELSLSSWLVFLLVVLWQMPHFYAISIFRKKDYIAAKLPVLGVVKDDGAVRRQMIAYSTAYVACVIVMQALGIFSLLGGLLLLSVSLYWLSHTLKLPTDYTKWSRKNFFISLQVSVVFVLAATLSVVVA